MEIIRRHASVMRHVSCGMRHALCALGLLALSAGPVSPAPQVPTSPTSAGAVHARAAELRREPAVDARVARVARGALIRWTKHGVQLPGSAETVGALLSDMPQAIRIMASVTGQNYVMTVSDTPGLFHLSTPRGLLADIQPVAHEHDSAAGRFQAVGNGVYHGPSHTLRGVFAMTIDYNQTRDRACVGTLHVYADLDHNPLLRLMALLFRGHINARAADEIEIMLAQALDVIAQKEVQAGGL